MRQAEARQSRGTQNGSDGCEQITVSVVTDDSLAADGVRTYLRTVAMVRSVPEDEADNADVVVVVTADLTEDLLAVMGKIHDSTVNPRQCMVLLSDQLTERQLSHAFRYGVVSMVPRRNATRESVVAAVLASGSGSAVLPGRTARWLADSGRNFERVVRATHGIGAGGLTTREVAVVRLLAEGMSSAEIARELNYAERTIKNIIAEMLTRMNLRNRVQAVAYAYRTGAI